MRTEAERARTGEVASLAAAVERAAVDLALAEEPAGFQAALEAGAPTPEPPAAPASPPS
jgi:hypothetical protein